jgi:creatinine amidohydrolase
MRWQDLRSPMIGSLSRDTAVILPTAAVEQHGPHLPTGTDSFIGQAVAEKADQLSGGRLLVCPVQQIGVSEHHMHFPGTLTLSHESFKESVMDTLSAIIRQGFRRVLVLNSHGGNMSVDGVIIEKAASTWPDAEVVFTSWWRVAAERIKPMMQGTYPAVGHACEFETSMMLALHPQLVDMAAAIDDGIPPKAKQLQGDMFTGSAAAIATPFHKITRHGVFGKPTLASAEKGRALIAEIGAAVRDLVVACWPNALAQEAKT